MIVIIILITLLSLFILIIGFFEVKLPFLKTPFINRSTKLNRHTKKLLRKKIWNSQMHKGFVKLPI